MMVWDVLQKYNVPSTWGKSEVYLLVDWFLFPGSVNALQMDKNNCDFGLTLKAGKVKVPLKVLDALRFAKMFAEAPEMMIEALPKIQRRLASFFNSPKGQLMFDAAIECDVSRMGKRTPKPRLWRSKADAYPKPFGIPITAKTVEKARESLRRVFPKTPAK
jgi:hypothetical protein